MTEVMLIGASCLLVQALLVPARFLSIGREYGPGGLDLSSIIAAVAGGVLGVIIDPNCHLPFRPILWHRNPSRGITASPSPPTSGR